MLTAVTARDCGQLKFRYLPYKQEVGGSSPSPPITSDPANRALLGVLFVRNRDLRGIGPHGWATYEPRSVPLSREAGSISRASSILGQRLSPRQRIASDAHYADPSNRLLVTLQA
jgi:hypothetical protein